MPTELAIQFAARLAAADARLSLIPEEHAARPIRDGGWSGKEVLGHLLDSVANNHQRFVRATLDGSYAGPGYAQEAWVALHGYGEWSWAELLGAWRQQNATLARIMNRMEERTLSAECTIGASAPVTLAFVIEDYLDHLEHHVKQIAAGSTGPRKGPWAVAP
jgi:hypothetical protein